MGAMMLATKAVGRRVGLVAGALALMLALLVGVRASFSDAKVADEAVRTPLGTYSLFARAASAADDVSGWPRINTEHAGIELDVDHARVVLADETRVVAAVPSNDGPCLLQRFAGGASGVVCGGADQLTVSLGYSGALGLAPDGVSSVDVRMVDGTARVIPVVNNVWRTPDEAATAALIVAGEPREITLMPRSSLPEGTTLHDSGLVTPEGAPDIFAR